MDTWYHIKNINELDSPALVIYPERVRKNISTLIGMVDDPERLRPHVKTHKSKDATKLLMDAGINKFKCATIAEAEMLASSGAKDVLLAYQPVGPKVNRFVSLIREYPGTRFSCLADHWVTVNEMAAIFEENNLEIPVLIDLNTGMNRTGISPDRAAIALYKHCSTMKGVKPIGFHIYDGNIRDADIIKRTEQCNQAFKEVEKLRTELMEMGLDEPVIVAGGSPTFPIHANRKNVECSPGTFIYWDKGYQTICSEQLFLPAALVITRVISLPSASTLCLDLGHKSVAAENNITNRIFFLNAPDLKAVSQSEEHLVVETVPDHSFKPGDILYGLPVHICPTVALYESAYIVESGKICGEWKTTARDRKIRV